MHPKMLIHINHLLINMMHMVQDYTYLTTLHLSLRTKCADRVTSSLAATFYCDVKKCVMVLLAVIYTACSC